ncbi:FMN-binding negative transcriptional regulator [Catalinimonas niigatensis]|uniref:FMN-binding negative transcriptional regulator n=1 Tax=Catalinimonas niigatensis TaxID=1397264 RepID=UPI00266538AD|nr:FMN-binding negative transcriptional regulator [Catalinimonas niigatensis]WPP50369.1 FMN-binding negative transcriptional regulator [Catalinimonas niigatensis]
MYTPKHYSITDQEEILFFIRRFNFGTIITSRENIPMATHLPFIVSKRESKLILISHFARANPHWQEITAHQNLVIFSEPHAYVSPGFYDKKQNVPTWNYISVHAYGQAKIIEEQEESLRILENMIDSFEAAYKAQWNTLDMGYKLRMLKGIVAFEIEVTELQAKGKLSQNKTEAERQRITASFSQSGSENERLIAEYMQKMNNV